MSQWLNLNKLSLNVKKQRQWLFVCHKKIIQPNIQINGSNIEFVENFMFLGITINNIAQSSQHFNLIIYADDTTLCSTLKINADATQLNTELNNVSQWLNLNKLSLNVKNPKAMAFRMPQKIIQPNIQINGSNNEFVENFMFLGITINNKLNWNSHINKVTNKISKTVGI